MNSVNLEIRIPAVINALRLSISEKLVFAAIREEPARTNYQLAALIGGTQRGVENLLRRLRQQGFIDSVGKGRARRLLFRVEHHAIGGDGSIAPSGALGLQPTTGASNVALRGPVGTPLAGPPLLIGRPPATRPPPAGGPPLATTAWPGAVGIAPAEPKLLVGRPPPAAPPPAGGLPLPPVM